MQGQLRTGTCYLLKSNDLVRRQRGDMPPKFRNMCSYSQDLAFDIQQQRIVGNLKLTSSIHDAFSSSDNLVSSV